MVENKTCRAWLEWLALQYPNVYSHVIRIENEGLTNRANSVSLGLHIGASDYLIAWPTLKYYGAMIEVKPDNWKPPSGIKAKEHINRQWDFVEKMRARGYFSDICVGVDDLINKTKVYLSNGEMEESRRF